jgi:hypothetical protein
MTGFSVLSGRQVLQTIDPILRAGARGLGHGREPQFVAAANVTAGELLGFNLVAPCDGSHDGLMFAQRFGDAAGRGEGGASKQHHGVVQVLQALQQKAIVGGAVDLLVEERIFPRVDLGIVGQLTMRIQHVDFGRIGKARRHPGRGTFEAFAHIIKFGDRAQVVLRDRKPATRRMDQHAVGLQTAHRFSDRGAADLEPGAELEFENALTGFEPAFLDRVAEGTIGLLGQPSGSPR